MSNTQSINIIEDAEGELRVSSLIISQQTQNEHRAVMQLIRNYHGELTGLGRVAFEMHPFETAGGTQRREVALLNEPQSTFLISLMRNSEIVTGFKLALVKEFYRMRQALAAVPALTEQEIVHQALQITVRQVQELEAKVAEDAPKVDYVDTYVADGDLRLLRNVAKSIGMSESDMRGDLLERKWIYAEHMTRWSETRREKETITRYSPYSHKAQYFEPVPNHYAPRFKGEVMHTLKVTPAGAIAIARLYGKHLHAVEAVAS